MFKAIKNERFFEQVAGSIQREILLGNLEPGQKLPNEAELAKQFSVGRSAVREALKVLELMGFLYVKRGHNGGTFVKPPDPDDSFTSATPIFAASTGWDQLMEARRVIEVKTAELAALRATEGEVLALGNEVERMRAASRLPARFIEGDVGFHLRIAEAARNEVFLVVINSVRTSLKKETNRIMEQPLAIEDILTGHAAVYEQIAARNPEQASREMARHLDRMVELLALVTPL